MNCEHVDLEPIEVERFQVKEVLKALLHSIIFQRALGAQQMRDTDSDLFDLSYVRSDSRAIDAKVEEQTEAFVKALERDETMAGHQVCLSFFELRVRPSTFGLFRSEEKVVWERWHIPLLVHARDDLGGQAERAQRSLALEDTLRQRIECVLSTAAWPKCHPKSSAPAQLLRVIRAPLAAPGRPPLPGERPVHWAPCSSPLPPKPPISPPSAAQAWRRARGSTSLPWTAWEAARRRGSTSLGSRGARGRAAASTSSSLSSPAHRSSRRRRDNGGRRAATSVDPPRETHPAPSGRSQESSLWLLSVSFRAFHFN